MRVIALDYGRKRIGVAVSDDRHHIALPLTVLESGEKLVPGLKKIIKDYRVETMVMGCPLDLEGNEGKAAAKVRKESERLERALNVKCVLWDERYTTKQAEMGIIRTGGRRSKKDDMVAAAIILQSYLDYCNRLTGETESPDGGDALDE
ncbi:MAG: Holliday junction resolvase RuvX, partial [bacterium]